jgi:hypothetical protein
MISRDHLSRIAVSDLSREGVLIEGDLGEAVKIELIEGIMLQISGNSGVFRIDLVEGELRGIFGTSREYALKTQV